MNDNPTIRQYLKTPFPDLTIPTHLPNPDPDSINEAGYHSKFIPNPESRHKEVERLYADAARYAALTLADNLDYFSDSTIDSHNQLIAFLVDMNNLIYGYDQTVTEQDALDHWLDDPDAFWNASEAYNPNFSPTDKVPAPALLEMIDFDRYWNEED